MAESQGVFSQIALRQSRSSLSFSPMKKMFFGILIATGLLVQFRVEAAAPIRVALIDGQNNHDWRQTTPVLKKLLEEVGLFQVEVITTPPDHGDFKSFTPDFAKYQVVVLNYNGEDWPTSVKSDFERYMRNGGGFVSVHAADNAFPAWREYNLMIGIGGWGSRDETSGPLWYFREGKLVSDTRPGPAGSHGGRLPFKLINRDTQHPITKGLPAEWVHAGDELYNSLRGPGTNMTVLATAFADPRNGGTGRDEPILMAISYGKGRVFHTAMGHDVPAMSCLGFITTFQRGVEWAATGNVTQLIPAAFPNATSVTVRQDIAAMAGGGR